MLVLVLLVFTAPPLAAGQSSSRAKDGKPAPSRRRATKLIVPGRSVGQIRLGRDIDTAFWMLGQSDGGDGAMGCFWYDYIRGPRRPGSNRFSASQQIRETDTTGDVYEPAPGTRPPDIDVLGITVLTDATRVRVSQIWISTSEFRTASGIHVGSSGRQVRRAYPKAGVIGYCYLSHRRRIDLYEDTADGIAFEVTVGPWRDAGGRCTAIDIHPRHDSVLHAYASHYVDDGWILGDAA